MTRRIPVTIVSGFLGAGKTTLLMSLVKHRRGRRLALLINEFGEVSVDGTLIGHGTAGDDEIRIHDFPSGLIAYGDDGQFVPTLRAIADRRADVDHVLIETSGLALPTAAMARLQTAALASDFVLDATLAVIDTPLLLAGAFARRDAPSDPATSARAVAELFEQQLEQADVIVLNKIDALTEPTLLAAETQVRKIAPGVRFVELAHHAALDARLALGVHLHEATSEHAPHRRADSYATSDVDPSSRYDGHAHGGGAPHTHGLMTHKHLHAHDPGWLTFALRSNSPQDPERLRSALAEAAETESILRAKGYVGTTHPAHRALVQGVRSRVSITVDAADALPPRSELVFIGYHLSRTRVAELLTRLTGTSWN